MAIKTNCDKCGNEFLIINKEVEFYKEKDFPLPKKCPSCRLERRLSLRNKKELVGYNCDKCGKDIIISFDPVEGQEIYCKECFQKYMQENDCILGYSDAAKAESSTPEKTESNTEQSSEKEVSEPVEW